MTDYIVYIDEAGDAAIDHNNRQVDGKHSEWLCLGGYLVTREQDNVLHDVRNELATLIGGTHGQALHFRRYTNENKEKICDLLGQKTARGFVVCSYKDTMRNYNNERARQAGTATSDRDHLYNFIIRLLLERVTNYVKIDARRKEIINPLLKVIFSYRKGHSAAHLKLYLNQLKLQAENETTHLNTRVIHPEVLQKNLIVCEDPKKVPGLQLADILTSAVYFSIDTEKLGKFETPLALLLYKIIAKSNDSGKRANEGITLFHPKADQLISSEQAELFNKFGYEIDLKNKTPR